MAGRVGEILAELATAIETVHSRLADSSPRSQQPDATALGDMQAAAQDLREAVSACMHSMPARFWVDALVARVRALDRPELAPAIAEAERKTAERYARP